MLNYEYNPKTFLCETYKIMIKTLRIIFKGFFFFKSENVRNREIGIRMRNNHVL